ncbi:hypothetical protein V8E36_000241 [Tilletia maclaganii]
MAESIPSGDLSVLLGKVPPFVSPSGWDVHDSEAGKAALFPTSDQKHKPEHERIPPLPLDDQHPFHIFVVAAQECPFGDAGRLATGVGMAGELGGLGRTKSKAHRDKDHPKHHKSKSSKHHNKDAESRPDGPTRLDTEKSDVSAPPSTTGSPKTPFGPAAGEYFPSSTVHNNNSVEAIAPLPPSSYEMPKADRSTVRGFSGKPGWSDLCENWLCSSRAAGSGSGGASASTPTAKSAGFSGMARLQSNSSTSSSQTPSSSAGGGAHGSFTPANDQTPASLGPYELVAKERMMGVYLAVYCWKGCRDRVQGSSKAYVKSGLLGARVGNKGAIGISVKMGGARLLFVNAHLAAHEGKVATRLQNIARIKEKLDCDTFLPSNDPRNMSEDVTERFDHVFWFGDLNFRIDITRQHADWLLMKKQYDQALEFDQLRKVMKDGSSNAFEGFQEAPITFPPTYKFDILSTLKKVKRSKTITKRILHRRTDSKEKSPALEVFESPTTETPAFAGGAALRASHSTSDAHAAAHGARALLPESSGTPAHGLGFDDDASSIGSSWGTSSGSDSDSRPVGQAKESQEEHTSSKPTTGDAANGGPPDSSSRINNESVKQVYDTSAKQRVPSWCDRVLWRSTVPIEEEEDESDDDDGDAAAADEAAVREGLAGRSSGGGVPSSPRRPSWWETHIAPRLLPSFLGPPSSSSNTTVDTDPSSSAAVLAAARTKKKRRKVKLTGPRRGEVQCLVYRSLGDREMVQLKARSDHRAVIWVGAVGI